MAKISEAAKAECNRMQNKYKELLQAVEVNIDKMEKELNLVDEGKLVSIMTGLEKACFYLFKLDKEYLKNFIKNVIK